jgi:type IX secretion system PorP/SprF family membrane protein
MKKLKQNNGLYGSIFSAMLLLFSASFLHAQDIHFSQPELAPLQLNPALAGSQNNVSGSLVSRTQWRAVPAPFNTVYAGADFKTNNASNWKFIAGLDAYNDRSGEPTLITNAFNAYAGSRVRLGPNTSLSAALGFGFRQLSTRPESGQWASQFNGEFYDGSLNSGEQFSRLQVGGINSSAGMLFQYTTDSRERKVIQSKKEFRFGLAAYNLNRPANAFLNGGDNRLPFRFTVFANSEFGVKGKKSSYMPAFYYQRQGKLQEFVFGLSIKYRVRNASQYTYYVRQFNLGWGVFCRTKDALIAKAFMDWGDFTLGVSYDINSSLLRESTNLRGGIEFALRYSMH